MKKSNIGMIGLAVMGENLSRNMAGHGYRVSVYDVREGVTEKFILRYGGESFYGATSFADLVASLEAPRMIMMMIRAGDPVDEVISKLTPHLSDGDIIIDGGNSRYTDTMRRERMLAESGILFIGTGVSGGEEGALHGPSLMPGGSREAWERVAPIFRDIAAKTPDGTPCCDLVGENGAGHFTKMVHNGIEYGDMQLISEVYHIMRDMLGLSNDRMGDIFAEWNSGRLDSYLISITSEILKKRDTDGGYLIDRILDAAGQKGTGKWTAISALDSGVPLTAVTEAVFARCLSSAKEERLLASGILTEKCAPYSGDTDAFIADLEGALFAAKIISYAQGYCLLREAAEEYGWSLNFGGIALMWRGGCIIRSTFLEKIRDAFLNDPELQNLMLDGYFSDILNKNGAALRRVCSAAALSGIPIPCLSSALSYLDGYRSASLPANLIQAQRDYFGAHTYERTDAPRKSFFHTDWSGHGGDTASTEYKV